MLVPFSLTLVGARYSHVCLCKILQRLLGPVICLQLQAASTLEVAIGLIYSYHIFFLLSTSELFSIDQEKGLVVLAAK